MTGRGTLVTTLAAIGRLRRGRAGIDGAGTAAERAIVTAMLWWMWLGFGDGLRVLEVVQPGMSADAGRVRVNRVVGSSSPASFC